MSVKARNIRLAGMTMSTVASFFNDASGYLDTTNYGLWPTASVMGIQRAACALGEGSFRTATRDSSLELSRKRFAQLVGADTADVAVGCSASQFVGLQAKASYFNYLSGVGEIV